MIERVPLAPRYCESFSHSPAQQGAVGGSCDLLTGQCVCKPYWTGQYCEQGTTRCIQFDQTDTRAGYLPSLNCTANQTYALPQTSWCSKQKPDTSMFKLLGQQNEVPFALYSSLTWTDHATIDMRWNECHFHMQP